MSSAPSERTLFSEHDIARRVRQIAQELASRAPRPEIAVPVLAGAFVFAADLLRGLAREGVQLETEFIWLRSYGRAQTASEVQVLRGPSEIVRDRTVLLIDGVLERGATLAKAKTLLEEAGAAEVITAVAVGKSAANRRLTVDYSLFTAGPEFLFGYGMDAAGQGRGLPDIRIRIS